MYRIRTVPGAVRVAGGEGARTSRSRHHRNAARVLPLPVGAWIRVWRPAAIAAQPPTWAGVGVSKALSNQARTGSENGSRADAGPIGEDPDRSGRADLVDVVTRPRSLPVRERTERAFEWNYTAR